MEANVLELHAFARAIDALIVFRVRLTYHLITENQYVFDHDLCLGGSTDFGWVIIISLKSHRPSRTFKSVVTGE